jgi:hypothetical protein
MRIHSALTQSSAACTSVFTALCSPHSTQHPPLHSALPSSLSTSLITPVRVLHSPAACTALYCALHSNEDPLYSAHPFALKSNPTNPIHSALSTAVDSAPHSPLRSPIHCSFVARGGKGPTPQVLCFTLLHLSTHPPASIPLTLCFTHLRLVYLSTPLTATCPLHCTPLLLPPTPLSTGSRVMPLKTGLAVLVQ